MRRAPDPELPFSRVSLPAGCSELLEAYNVREASDQERSKLLLRISAMLHDSLVSQLDPEILQTRDPNLLIPRISDYLHPILLANRQLEKKIGPSSDLVGMLFDVVIANLEDDPG